MNRTSLKGLLDRSAKGVGVTSKDNILPKKRSKYGNKKKVVDGITFDSEKEANRYIELKWMQDHHVISGLRLQVHYELNPGGTFSYKYIADFVYAQSDHLIVVEDVKGYKTREFKKKAKLMEKVHGIKVRLH